MIIMSSETAVCPGCNNTFTLRGYQSHLSQSNDPLCHSVFDQLKKAQTYELEHEQTAGSSHEAEVPAFEGDTFGSATDYTEDTFGQAEDLEPSDGEEDDDEDVEHMVAELEKSWEPLREGAPDQLGEEIGETNNEDNSESDSGLEEDLDHGLDRYIIGDGYGVKPAVRIRYKDKYLSSRAGEALSWARYKDIYLLSCAGEVLSQEESRDSGYGAAFSNRDGLGSWAPFNSKKDWEIAKWAKLRGVGSTAFSDFLSIDEVILMLHYIHNTHIFDRFAKHSTFHTKTLTN